MPRRKLMNGQTDNINIPVTPELKRQVREEAARRDQSMTTFVRYLIRLYFENRKRQLEAKQAEARSVA